MPTDSASRPYRAVRELPAEVARKIAAGEVIDRPAAVIRELLDNAIDAGATRIEVEIDSGGIERIRVRDNGCGMTKEDLALCTKTHTTSKIFREDDLLTLSTLGFRGEALSSIHAVSTVEMRSARDGAAWKLDDRGISPDRLPEGTIVELRGLFANFPARRQFLKSPASEAALCRQVVIEKALAWPGISFRYTSGSSSPLVLPEAPDLRTRVLAALNPGEHECFFHAVETSAEGFSAAVIAGTPDCPRANRKNLMVFVNGRRIQEYSLVQAMEYGAQGYFPNGTHPFAILFVTMDPSLVDFNIHPAKKEVRFRDAGSVHHAVSSMMRNFYRNGLLAGTGKPEPDSYQELFRHTPEAAAQNPPSAARFTRDSFAVYDGFPRDPGYPSALAEAAARVQSPPPSFRYLGQVLGTFLLVEKDDSLYLIDQHAAHERILYNELKDRGETVQELLVPYRIETGSAQENAVLDRNREALGKAGFVIEEAGESMWQATAVPARWRGTEADLRRDLLDACREPGDLVNHLLARTACRAACKDGNLLDPGTARDLAERALALPEPVCPHGRPVWTVISRQELFSRVKRT